MKIREDFIRDNNKIEIISNRGNPSVVPQEWQPVLDSCDMLVAIPDMHMYLYDSNQDNFKYGVGAMLGFLDHLDTLKHEMALERKTLRIYQLGDLYEQRFPGREGNNATAIEIRMSHPDYDQIINMMNGMRMHYIYGNHDFELRHYPGFRYNALEGKVYMEHGFTPDSWKTFSDPDEFLWEAGQLVFKTIREIEAFFTHLLVETSVIEKDEHFAIGVRSGEEPDYDYPSEQTYEDKYKDRHLDYFTKRLRGGGSGPDTRICVIGHTHQPYINTNIDHGEYIYVDAGAWTAGRSDFAVITNEEVGVCCYNR